MMKRILAALLTVCMMPMLFCACNGGGGNGSDTTTPETTPETVPPPIANPAFSEFQIVRPDEASQTVIEGMQALNDAVRKKTGKGLSLKTDFRAADEIACEILIGSTNREATKTVAAQLQAGDYVIKTVATATSFKIVVLGANDALTLHAAERLAEMLANGEVIEETGIVKTLGISGNLYSEYENFSVELGEPTVVYQSPTNMKQDWGYYQFPRLYQTADGGLIANWNYSEDTALGGGDNAAAIKNAYSADGGKTWTPLADDEVNWHPRAYTDVPTKDGKSFVTFVGGGSYVIPKEQLEKTKVYDRGQWFGSTFYVFLASDIAKLDLTDVNGNVVDAFKNPEQISMVEYYNASGKTVTSKKTLNWANMPVYGEIRGDSNTVILTTTSTLMAISAKSGMVEKDGVLYYATYTKGFEVDELKADHHYGVYVFSSTDGGDTWNCISKISRDDLPAGNYDYYDGPCEPTLHVMPDGSLVIIARTGASDNGHKDPSVITRSTDNGKTWSKPQIFGSVGVLPQTLTLDCGVTIATYGRPGLFFRATSDPSGCLWQEEQEITDLSPLKNGQTVQSCFYTGLYALDSNTALLIYADFNHPNGNGGYSKAILVRTVNIVPK